MGIACILSEKHHIVFITFTALLLTELIMVALTIRTWHWIMLLAEIFSVAVYLASLYLLDAYFGKEMIFISDMPEICHFVGCRCLYQSGSLNIKIMENSTDDAMQLSTIGAGSSLQEKVCTS